MGIVQTPTFMRWFTALRDAKAKSAIARSIGRIELGIGDTKPVGDKVFEARIHIGPGYRVYFTVREGTVIILLAGGDKRSQDRDIATAKSLAATY